MLKSLFLAAAFAAIMTAFGAAPQQKTDDKSTHHAAMHAEHTVHHSAIHAEHWLDHHMSAPHTGKHPRRRIVTRKKNKSVHHAAMHAEHWIDHHVSSPHKKTGN